MGRGIPEAFNQRRLKKGGHPSRLEKAKVAAPAPAPPAPAPAPPAPAPEAPAFSMENSKAELLAEGERLELDVNNGMTKAQILAAIEAA
jgi:hypothetical protein